MKRVSALILGTFLSTAVGINGLSAMEETPVDTVSSATSNQAASLSAEQKEKITTDCLKGLKGLGIDLEDWQKGQIINYADFGFSRGLLAGPSTNVDAALKLISTLSWLKRLDLSINCLSTLPHNFLSSFPQLEWLALNDNKLKSLPEDIGTLTSLEHLDVRANKLGSLPSSLGNLVNLKHFNAWVNEIRSLPPSFANLVNMEELDLNNNCLKEFPLSMQGMTRLKSLSLHHNYFKEVPPVIEFFTDLEELVISDTQIAVIPAFLQKLTKIQELSFHNTGITEIPDWVQSFPELGELSIYGCNLTSTPTWIKELEERKVLVRIDPPRRHGCC